MNPPPRLSRALDPKWLLCILNGCGSAAETTLRLNNSLFSDDLPDLPER
jgi:hypothetical protein